MFNSDEPDYLVAYYLIPKIGVVKPKIRLNTIKKLVIFVQIFLSTKLPLLK